MTRKRAPSWDPPQTGRAKGRRPIDPEGKLLPVCVSLTVAQVELLTLCAESWGISRSSMTREIVRMGLQSMLSEVRPDGSGVPLELPQLATDRPADVG